MAMSIYSGAVRMAAAIALAATCGCSTQPATRAPEPEHPTAAVDLQHGASVRVVGESRLTPQARAILSEAELEALFGPQTVGTYRARLKATEKIVENDPRYVAAKDRVISRADELAATYRDVDPSADTIATAVADACIDPIRTAVRVRAEILLDNGLRDELIASELEAAIYEAVKSRARQAVLRMRTEEGALAR